MLLQVLPPPLVAGNQGWCWAVTVLLLLRCGCCRVQLSLQATQQVCAGLQKHLLARCCY
jgi:hypothetical protein